MYDSKALVWIALAAYIFTTVTGDNRAGDTDAIRYVTKNYDVRKNQSMSKPLKDEALFVEEKKPRKRTKHDSMNINKSTTNRQRNYETNFSEKTEFVVSRHKYDLITTRRETLRRFHNMHAFRNVSTKIMPKKKHWQNTDSKKNETRNTVKQVHIRNLLRDKNQTEVVKSSRVNSRKRRYAYEDNYDWQYDESFDYDDDSEETKKWKKYAKNWDKIGLRFIYLGSTIIMVTCCCCLCCRKCCKLACDTCYHFVMNCFDRCRCRDPMYRKIQTLSDQLGIQMDYDTYKNLKQGYTQELAEQGFKVNI